MAIPLPVYKADFYAPSIGCPRARPPRPLADLSLSRRARPRGRGPRSQSTDTFTDAMLVLSGGGSLPGSHLHSDKMRLDWKASFTQSQIRLLGLNFSLSISQKEVPEE